MISSKENGELEWRRDSKRDEIEMDHINTIEMERTTRCNGDNSYDILQHPMTRRCHPYD